MDNPRTHTRTPNFLIYRKIRKETAIFCSYGDRFISLAAFFDVYSFAFFLFRKCFRSL